MRIQHVIIGCLSILAVSTASAAESHASREENIGAGTGLVIGALAGGPVGAIVGVAVGAKLGESYSEKAARINLLDKELASGRKDIADLRKDVRRLGRDKAVLDSNVRRLEAMNRPELVSLLEAGIEMDLLFRTDEHVLAEATGHRLQAMAGTLKGITDVHVRLDGYSDERGDAQYNQDLSKRRAEHVRDVLVASGLPASRIEVSAHGESTAGEKTTDSYALERKVSLTLFVADSESPSVAAAPGN
ncbi:MAG: DUF456 family protein [Pseudomonadota bacterium]